MLTKQDKKFLKNLGTEIVELKDIGNKIKRIRKEKKVYLGKLSKESKVSEWIISMLEGDGSALLNEVQEIFTALNCKIAFVVQEKGKGE